MEFNLVQSTTRAPFNRCYLCDDHEGPFVDCFKDQFGHGGVFICAPRYGPTGDMIRPGCVGQMAKKAAMLYPHETLDQAKLIDEYAAEIARLKETQKIEMSFQEFLDATKKPKYEFSSGGVSE